jgi:hypothetical protein
MERQYLPVVFTMRLRAMAPKEVRRALPLDRYERLFLTSQG